MAYDLFISYKSEDVALARQIADALIACRWRVWLAEYEVLLVVRHEFQSAVERGIRKSRLGLAIANNRWATSEYCSQEIKSLLKEKGSSRVLQVMHPQEDLPQRYYPELADSPSIVSDSVAYILQFVGEAAGRELGLSVSPPILGATSGIRFETRVGDRPLSLVTEGWAWDPEGVPDPSDDPDEEQVGAWRFSRDDRLGVNVLFGHATVHGRAHFDETIDDRRVFDDALEWLAPHHVRSINRKPVGVHLLFHGGMSHFGLTFKTRFPPLWFRKISLVVSNPATLRSGEFLFTFCMRGTFFDYCRHAQIMDTFAVSLDWQ